MNKSENIADRTLFPRDSFFVSAKEGLGIDDLLKSILQFFRQNASTLHLKVPYTKISSYSKLKKYAVEKKFDYRDDALYIDAVIDHKNVAYFKEYIIS